MENIYSSGKSNNSAWIIVSAIFLILIFLILIGLLIGLIYVIVKLIPVIDDIDDVVDDIKNVNLIKDLDNSVNTISSTLTSIKNNISSVSVNVINFINAAITDLAAISKAVEDDLGLIPPAVSTLLEEIEVLYNQIKVILAQVEITIDNVQQIVANIISISGKLNILCPLLESLPLGTIVKTFVRRQCNKTKKNHKQVINNFESFGISVSDIRNYVSNNNLNINEFKVITNISSNIPEEDKQEMLSKIQEIENDNEFIRVNINMLDVQNIIQIISKFLNIQNTGFSILEIIDGLENLTELENSQLVSKVSTINLNSDSSNYVMQYLGSLFNQNDEELTEFLNNLQGNSNILLNNTGTGTNGNNNNCCVENSSLEKRKRIRRRKKQKCYQNDVSNAFSDALKCIKE